MRKITPIALVGSLLSLLGLPSFTSSEAPVLHYIEQYKPIAISEMQRTNIPASITLAQGIVESRHGTSTLAKASNNHFGIKCKSNWEGPTYYHKDDDFQNGKLVNSCFRSYADPVQSYFDHSDFLLDNPRYKPLFRLQKTDYKGWAKGLKTCGYATDNKYAFKLIETIEKYQLYRYDQRPVDLIVQQTISTRTRPATSPPKAVVLPNNYKPGQGTRQQAMTNKKRAFQDDVFKGEKPYLFEIVPNVERRM